MVVPFMALGYIIVACVIIAINIEKLPAVILLIWKSAFGLEAGFGAILGRAIMWALNAAYIPTRRRRAPGHMHPRQQP